jgi:hypothetical protein
MARKKQELLEKLSALKPSAPTRTRGGRAARPKTAKPAVEKPAAEAKAKAASPAAGKGKAAAPGRRKKPAASRKPASPAAPAEKAVKTGKAQGQPGQRREMAPPEAAAKTVKAAAAPDRPVEAKPELPRGERPEAPPKGETLRPWDAWNTWRIGFFRAMPGAGCSAFGDVPEAALREAAGLQKFWTDGWLRWTRIILDILDLQMKVVGGLGRPWTGGR